MKIKNSKFKKTFHVAAIPLAVSLSLASFAHQVLATGLNPTATKQADSKIVKKNGFQKQVVKEAADAFKATGTALKALDNNQPKQALSALQVASGNLHLLVARDPALDLVPIDIQVQFIEGIRNLKTIKKLEDKLEDLIDDGHYQAARPIVDSLVDEVRITTVSLPLATYPKTIDQVAPLVDAGKIDEARQMLIDVLDTFVVEEEVTPLTIIHADEKLTEAFQIEHTADLSKQETKNKIETLVNEAKQDINIAQALGYGVKDDYSGLYEGIDALKKAIGESGFKGEWLKLKKSLSSLKSKIVHP